MLPSPARLALRPMLACLLTFLVVGCGNASGVTAVPVTGQITVDGQPLQAENATVVFKPARGNPTLYEPYGSVDDSGRYTVRISSNQKGAQPGWYKVVVAAVEMSPNERRGLLSPAKNYRLLVNRRYGDRKTSGLEIEVVHNPAPGAYDLKLTK